MVDTAAVSGVGILIHSNQTVHSYVVHYDYVKKAKLNSGVHSSILVYNYIPTNEERPLLKIYK